MAPSVDDTGEQQFWVDTLTPDEREQWKAYLKDLRKKYPNNTWRLSNDKRYHRACKDGFLQRNSNIDRFVRETCVQANTD